MELHRGKRETSSDRLDPQLQAWLDDELDGEERGVVEKRLGSDPAARDKVEILGRLDEWLSASTPEASPGLSERIQQAIREERRQLPEVAITRRDRRLPGWLWIAGLSAAAAVVLAFLWMGAPGRKVMEGPTGRNVVSTVIPPVEHEFLLEAPGAKEVCLVGDFNGWEVCKTPMNGDDRGLWRIRVRLPSGRHEYMFVVDGQWVTDPRAAMRVDDGFGSQNAVVLL